MRGAALRSAGALALALLFAPAGLPPAAGGEPGSWVGRPLTEVLDELRHQGLRIVYSSDLVRPGMRVESEPTASRPQRLLDEVLGPHRLQAQVGPGGTLMVVHRPLSPVLVSITRPHPGQAAFGAVEIAAEVLSDERVDRVEFRVDGALVAVSEQPPHRAVVDVGGENVDRRFEVVARGAWGGVGRATVTTRRTEIQEQLEVALKQLFVSVADRRDRPVDLGREAFTLFDRGERQQLVTFEHGDVPITAVLLVDGSESMRGAVLRAALGGARSFVDRMRPLDRAMLLLFSDRTLAMTDFSPRPRARWSALAADAGGGTALNDHLYAALRLLDEEQGRRVVIVFSDGTDVQSVLSMEDVLWKLRRTDAILYWIRLDARGDAPSLSSAWRDVEANDREREGLTAAVRESGGRILDLPGPDAVGDAYLEVMEELRGQFVLGYYPSDRHRDGAWREVRVAVDAAGVRARYRTGYFDR